LSLDIDSLPPDKVEAAIARLEAEKERRVVENALAHYEPYPKQAAFHAAGASKRERLLMAANQSGKSLAGGMECAMHSTGRYPEWWQGKRFDKPTIGWVAGTTNETTRDTVQRILVGRSGQQGTGTVPRDAILELVPARGTPDLLDSIKVRHASGGVSSVTASQITSRLATVNQVFAPADVEFVFDETDDFLKINSTLLNRDFTLLEPPNVEGDKWDHEPLVDVESHNAAREELAKQYPHKLVLLFHNRKKLAKDPDTGHWQVVSKGGGSSGWAARYVNMSTSSGANDLAHEIGHYLQIPHPFVSGVETVAEAATRIKDYVEGGHPKSQGLDALDGDRDWVLDTPADVAGSIFEAEGLEVCGDVGEISIPVTFADQSKKTYTLAPDRSLVMRLLQGLPGAENDFAAAGPPRARRP
jgi:Terminase large subunit, T4likevirus-type, N-terminal